MRRNVSIKIIAAATGLVFLILSSESVAATGEKFSSEAEKESYSLGVVVASQAMSGLGEVDTEAFVAGVSDVLRKNDFALDDAEIQQSLTRFDERRAEKAQLELASVIESNRIAGDAFRKNFSEDPGVETLESGLQYKVIQAGKGNVPSGDDTVTIHYRGALVDGREIDSSYNRNEPVTIQVDKVIPGWTEALTRMPVGSKWQVVIPPDMAYGDLGAGDMVEPGSTVVFEMELISTS